MSSLLLLALVLAAQLLVERVPGGTVVGTRALSRRGRVESHCHSPHGASDDGPRKRGNKTVGKQEQRVVVERVVATVRGTSGRRGRG
jgi:hypothetical protein